MRDTNFIFNKGKLSILMDAGAGSSGKGKIASYICENADNYQFACNAFSPQAGHWVRLNDGREFFYQTFNSCAYLAQKLSTLEKLYIGPGAIIELAAFYREIKESNIPRHKIGISPVAAILQDIDSGFERGQLDFDGNPLQAHHDGTMKTGTTAHGAGACRARRVLRRKEAKYARDLPELAEFICDVPGEIMARLDAGQSGLLEIAQGFQLSYLLPNMFPYTTSRNCSTMAAMDDMMLPVHYAGNVILNVRTFPIRIANNKYIGENGKHLTWAEVQEYTANNKPYQILVGNSGPGYPDQMETTWEEITKNSGSPTPIMEMTSVTKLPRRPFTFSQENLKEAIKYNRANGDVFISLNFANYVDYNLTGTRAFYRYKDQPDPRSWFSKTFAEWLNQNMNFCMDKLCFIGTGAKTEETIILR